MGMPATKHWLSMAVVALTILAAPAAGIASGIVNPGFDLLHTEPGTSVGGVPFTGVPLGSFDFGGGAVPTGNADTIVERLAAATAPGPPPAVPIELVALQLMSVVPVDFGLGVGFYFVTLQSARGGPASTGTMGITFGPEGVPHGTFDSFFDVFFDIRLGSLDGPIALSNNAPLTSVGAPWAHFPPSGAVEIPGVNTLLNGLDRESDFFPVGTFTEQHPGPPSTIHVVSTATDGRQVPEPSAAAALVLALAALFSYGVARGYAR
jgi:hypothetical protein